MLAVNFMTIELRFISSTTCSLISIKLNIGLLRLHWLPQSSNKMISKRVFKIFVCKRETTKSNKPQKNGSQLRVSEQEKITR